MSKNNIKIKNRRYNEEEEPTYENLESIQGLISNINPEIKEEVAESGNESIERSPQKKKRRIQKKKVEEEFNYDEEENQEESFVEQEPEPEPEYNDDYSGDEIQSEESAKKFSKKKRKRSDEKRRNKKKNKSHKKNKNKRRGGINEFLEEEAVESESDDESEGDGEISRKEQSKLMEEALNRRDNKVGVQSRKRELEILNMDQQQLEKHYEEIEYEETNNQSLQPGISDPKLFLIKCKPGKERESVQILMHKYFDKSNESDRIKILSAASFDSLKGYIYIEAFKEANVREAIIGISSLRENSIKIVPLTEMTGVFNFDKIQKVNIKANQWVRVKSGLYENDLAQIVHIEDPMSKIYIRIIPRLVAESFETTKDTLGEYSKKIRKSVRPLQKLFNPLNFSDVIQKSHPILAEKCHMWNKQSFINGFLIKSVRINSLITEDVVPKIEELKIFEMVRHKTEEEDKTYDIKNILESLDQVQVNRKKKFAKGDKVKITKGGLKGITGKIDFHSDGVVRVVPDIEGITDLLEFPEDYVVKEFLPGDLVKIISGPHIGKQGLIVKVEEEAAYIFSESTNSEFIVGIHDLVYSNFFANEYDTNSFYNLGDLVRVNGASNNISYIIEVNKYNLRLIDTRSEVKRVSVNEVTKLTGLKPNGLDCRRNPITINDNVKIINGHYKGKRGVIKNIFKNQVFLYNQDFVSTNGIFVDKSENIEIMGSELLSDNYNGSSTRVNIRKAPDHLQRNIGKLVRVIAGNWKGYVGVLNRVTDIKAAVELTSKNKTINLDIPSIELIDSDANSSRYDTNATPRNNYANKTPAYYPTSPSGLASPGWGSGTYGSGWGDNN